MASREINSHPTIKKYLFPEESTSTTLVSGTDTYALPADYNFQVQRVLHNADSGVELKFVQQDKILNLQNVAGSVEYYTVRGTDLILAASPGDEENGDTLTIWYAKTDGDYSNDSLETTLGERFPHLLINKVCFELAMSEQDGEIASVADRFDKAYQRGLDQAVASLSQQGTTSQKYIEITGGDPL